VLYTLTEPLFLLLGELKELISGHVLHDYGDFLVTSAGKVVMCKRKYRSTDNFES